MPENLVEGKWKFQPCLYLARVRYMEKKIRGGWTQRKRPDSRFVEELPRLASRKRQIPGKLLHACFPVPVEEESFHKPTKHEFVKLL